MVSLIEKLLPVLTKQYIKKRIEKKLYEVIREELSILLNYEEFNVLLTPTFEKFNGTQTVEQLIRAYIYGDERKIIRVLGC